MKKNILKGIITIFYSLIFIFLLTSCTASNESSFLGVKGYNSSLNDLEIKINVNNEVDNFNFQEKIIVSEKATLKVFSDINYKNEITSFDLFEGDNLFYLVVRSESGKNLKNYTLNVVREIIHDITYSSGQGYTIVPVTGASLKSQVKNKEDLFFKINLDEEYSPNIVVRANGVQIFSVDGIYSLYDVSQDTSIVVSSVEINKFNVEYPIFQQGYKIKNIDDTIFITHHVNYGEDIYFKVVPNEGYSDNLIVYVNEEITEKDDQGFYQILSIKNNINISVSTAQKISYEISFPNLESQVNYALKDINGNSFNQTTIEYGSNLIFKVEFAEGYEDLLIVTNNGSVVPQIDGRFSILNVKENIDIRITDYTALSFDLIFPSVQEGYKLLNLDDTIFDKSSIKYGESISFKLQAEEGYISDHIVSINNVILQNIDGIYTISDALGTIKISVSESNKQSILINNNVNEQIAQIVVVDENGLEIDVKQIFWGEPIYVKVILGEDYGGQPILFNNMVQMEYDEEKEYYYILENKEDINFSIEGILKVKFNITYPSTNQGVVAMPINQGDTLPTKVSLNDSIQFRIVAAEGFDISGITIFTNLTEKLQIIGEIYTFTDINQDLIIIFAGAQKLVLEASYPNIEEMVGYYLPNYNSEFLYGENLEFQIEFLEGYQYENAIVKNNGVVISGVQDEENPRLFRYSLENLKENALITIDVELVVYQITYIESIDQTYSYAEKIYQVKHGKNASFKILILDGYYLDYSINETEDLFCELDQVNLNQYNCLLINISSDLIIEPVVFKKVYFVTYEDELAYTVVDAKTHQVVTLIEHGESLSFYIRLNEGFALDGESLNVYYNENIVVSSEDEIYTISNIEEDIHISVTGYLDQYLTISFDGEGYSVIPQNNIDSNNILRGSDFKFTLLFDYEKYIIPEEISVFFGNELVEKDDQGVYTISNIQTDGHLLVDGLSIKTFSINFVGEGFSITSDGELNEQFEVKYGDDFNFIIFVYEWFEGSPVVFNATSDTQIELIDESYTLNYVTNDILIEITNLNRIKYNINYLPNEQYQILSSDKSSQLENSADAQTMLIFYVDIALNYGPTEDGVKVKNNGEIIPNQYYNEVTNEIFVSLVVDGDINISVEGLTESNVKFEISLYSDNILLYDEQSNLLNNIFEVSFVENYRLKVVLGEAFEESENYGLNYYGNLIKKDEFGFFNIPVYNKINYLSLEGYTTKVLTVEFIYEDGLFLNEQSNILVFNNILYDEVIIFSNYVGQKLDGELSSYALFLDQNHTIYLKDEYVVKNNTTIYIIDSTDEITLTFFYETEPQQSLDIQVIKNQTSEEDVQNQLTLPVKDGYIFRGWYLNNLGSDNIYDNDCFCFTNFNYSVNFYAKWVENYSITIDWYESGLEQEIININSETISSSLNFYYTPQKDGFIFTGYYLTPNFESNQQVFVSQFLRFEDDTYLYAKLIPEYYISFNSGQIILDNPIGDLKITQDFESGTMEELGLIPSASGYVFVGWYLDPQFNTSMITSTTQFAIFYKDTIVYARFIVDSPLEVDDQIIGEWYSNTQNMESYYVISSSGQVTNYVSYSDYVGQIISYWAYKLGEDYIFINQNNNFIVSINNGQLLVLEKTFDRQTKNVVVFKDGQSDLFVDLKLVGENQSIDLVNLPLHITTRYWYIDIDNKTTWDFANVVDQEILTLYGFNNMIHDITITFYIGIEGEESIENMIVSNLLGVVPQLPNPLFENFIFIDWVYDGVYVSNMNNFILAIANLDSVELVAFFVEKIDYSLEPIVGAYIYEIQEGMSYQVVFNSDSSLDIYFIEGEIINHRRGYWRHIEENSYQVTILDVSAIVEFVDLDNEQIEDDIIIIEEEQYIRAAQ